MTSSVHHERIIKASYGIQSYLTEKGEIQKAMVVRQLREELELMIARDRDRRG